MLSVLLSGCGVSIPVMCMCVSLFRHVCFVVFFLGLGRMVWRPVQVISCAEACWQVSRISLSLFLLCFLNPDNTVVAQFVQCSGGTMQEHTLNILCASACNKCVGMVAATCCVPIASINMHDIANSTCPGCSVTAPRTEYVQDSVTCQGTKAGSLKSVMMHVHEWVSP